MTELYKYICNNIKVTEENKDFLSRFVFAYKITCFDENIENVIIRHKFGVLRIEISKFSTLIERDAYIAQINLPRKCLVRKIHSSE